MRRSNQCIGKSTVDSLQFKVGRDKLEECMRHRDGNRQSDEPNAEHARNGQGTGEERDSAET
jgi:hypothetical protein